MVLTVGAIWQATGAKKAATEARQAVYRRNAADAMVEIVRIAEQLNTSDFVRAPSRSEYSIARVGLSDSERPRRVLAPSCIGCR